MARSESAEHHLVVDRFEGDLVVVEADGDRFHDLPRWLFPDGLREGDVVIVRVGGGAGERQVELRVDDEATRAAKREVGEIVDRLKRRDPGGDIEL